ncbi:beta-galactosidase [Actinoplanes sp. N902-109]|nr:beta-galactosidase [Actinoplanes sp. N902-109]
MTALLTAPLTALLTALLMASSMALLTAPLPAHAAGKPAKAAHAVTFDGYSFLVDGTRTYLWSGEFHYFRLPSPGLWRDIFQKMKAAGFNTTSLYFDWGYHSPRPGVYDFTGVRDVDLLLDMAQQAGLYVIARPAPYINAEVDGGGLPGWLTTKDEHNRTDDPKFYAYADEWLSRIDTIVARHQLTNGTGTVIAYQVENEYYNGDAPSRRYMQHLEDKARADGITVPLTGNNNGTFNEGVGKLDIDGPDAYPQGFNCSNPSVWQGVPDIGYDHPAGRPLYTPEFQGGAFDPWGGPGYDKCAQLINDQFANVFYKNNIAVGSTAQSFYMTYGGTNWGWLGEPQNYTSYDYGAAIRENRQLDPKYYQDKLIGYLTQSVPDLTKTDRIPVTAPDNPAVLDTARRNPDTGAQFHVLRHTDSTSTAVDRTHIAIDVNARTPSYTHDDADAALQYTGAWSHVADQSYTGSDYRNTESFSRTAGDALTVPFTGSTIRWIGSRTGNHGYADVYLDGVKQTTVDASGLAAQAVLFQATGLADGPHTLRIVVTGTHAAGSTDDFVAVDAIDLSPAATPAEPVYPSVPQKPGTAITLNGRESKLIVAGIALGGTQLRYSTSELLTQAGIGARDVAVLYGDPGTDGETVLHAEARPVVRGAVEQTWDPATGDLRLNYTHSGLARVTVQQPGHRPLLLLLADKPTAETFWRQDTATGPVLVRGTHLLRTATSRSGGRTLDLTGDNGTDPAIEVFSTATTIRWNGAVVRTGGGSGTIPAAAPISLPALKNWQHETESPEAQPGFDDSAWVVADKTTTFSSTGPGSLPVLYADDYGFHTGSTWYRGRFPAPTGVTGVHLTSDSGGGAQAFSVWVNGVFLGSSTTGTGNFPFPAGVLTTGDNILSVLTVNMGHEEDYNSTNGNKAARGLTGASLIGAPATPITWRLQGVRGGEKPVDPVRGPLATGGLFGERAGWQLPGFNDRRWDTVSLPDRDTTPGVSWYRTTADLRLPKGQDTSLGLTIADDPSHRYRAELYVNGWLMGNYVNYLGPQHSFPIPNGILRTRGRNTIAIAVWNLDGTTGGLGQVSLTSYGSYASALKVDDVESPGYDARTYAIPPAPKVSVRLQVPSGVRPGTPFTATATVSGLRGGSAADAELSAPAGWTVSAPARVSPTVFRWQVTPPTGPQPVTAALTATVTYRGGSARDERIVGSYAPPPAGQVAVSSLPFLSAANGWGPVERDTSNGEQAAGDGRPISIAGQAYPLGLGTHATSDIQLYLGGGCTRFTAAAGVDDEQNGGGSVSFQVLADGRPLVTTPVLRGGAAATPIDVDVTGAQALELVVSDGGDGNGSDHADWAVPTLVCG